MLLLRIFLICPGWNQEPTLIQKRKSQSQTVSTYHHRYSCYSNWGVFFTFFFGCFKRWGRVMQCWRCSLDKGHFSVLTNCWSTQASLTELYMRRKKKKRLTLMPVKNQKNQRSFIYIHFHLLWHTNQQNEITWKAAAQAGKYILWCRYDLFSRLANHTISQLFILLWFLSSAWKKHGNSETPCFFRPLLNPQVMGGFYFFVGIV